jgi:CPA1 family monovalent cation:H+ antiporter
MHTVEIVLSLFAAVAALAFVARYLKVPYPIFLVIGGLGLSFVPGLPRVALEPEIVFVLFLPPILYYAGIQTSWRDFKANARPIGLLAFGLVVFTTVAVASVGHYGMGMGWAPAFALGAIVSPPDAVAATSIMARLRIPRRLITILEGESLVNDATALVALRLAVAAVVYGTFSWGTIAWQLPWVAIGGVAVGMATGVVIAWIRKRLNDDGVEALLSLLTPYIAYLPAERVGASGVLAAVTAGVYISRRLPRIATGHTRLRLAGIWETHTFILNGLVFILIGLQLPTVVERLGGPGLARGIRDAAVVGLLVIALRMIWVFPATYVPRRLWRKLREKDPAPPRGAAFMIAWTGMRGIVTLAAALALPVTLADGVTPFPHRDLIILISFGVILLTLVVQGLTLPLVIRLAALGEDGIEENEEIRARFEGVHAALTRLDSLVLLGEARPELVNAVRGEYERRARYWGARLSGADGADAATEVFCENHEAVVREVIEAQRGMVIKLRDDGVIGDDVLRRIQQELDHEESLLEH